MAISLDSLERGQENKPPRIVVYGTKGIGKTSFASSAPEPVIIQTEDGIGLLDTPRFPIAKSFADVLAAIGVLLKEDHKFKTVILDSADWTERLIHAQVRVEHGDKIFSEYGKGYTFAVPHFENLLGGLNALRERKGMTVVITAHAITKRYESPDVEPYDRYFLDLHSKVGSALEEWCDVLMFANYKVITKATDTGFGNKQVRGVGVGERILFCEERPAFTAKNRYRLPAEMPFDWKAFEGAMVASRGVKKAA